MIKFHLFTETFNRLFFQAVTPKQAVCFGPICPQIATKDQATATAGNIFGSGIRIFLIIAGFTALLYMLMGAYNWITSGGEKEKVKKAQDQITYGAIGVVVVVIVLVLFFVIVTNVLGIFGPNGTITLPTLF
ncbi:MAG: hypothetical protein WCO06_00815 [Candidatus Roizmanbacteria bacterium]